MHLKRNERCPIHNGRRDCCGRSEFNRYRQVSKVPRGWTQISPGVRRFADGREKRSPAAMRKLLMMKVKEQMAVCPLCELPFTDMFEIVPDHREPRGMGGSMRDDSPKNIQATHALCNLIKASRRLPVDA